MENNVTKIKRNQVAVISTPVCDDIILVATDSSEYLGLMVKTTNKPLSTVVDKLIENFGYENIIEVVVDEENEKYVESAYIQSEEILCAMIVEEDGVKHLKAKIALQKLKEKELFKDSENELSR